MQFGKAVFCGYHEQQKPKQEQHSYITLPQEEEVRLIDSVQCRVLHLCIIVLYYCEM